MQSIENRILSRIQGKARGTCFTPKAFLDLGSPEAVRIALHRLEKRGVIRRLTRGLYDFPKRHPTIGFLSPSPDEVAKALSERDASRLQAPTRPICWAYPNRSRPASFSSPTARLDM